MRNPAGRELSERVAVGFSSRGRFVIAMRHRNAAANDYELSENERPLKGEKKFALDRRCARAVRIGDAEPSRSNVSIGYDTRDLLRLRRELIGNPTPAVTHTESPEGGQHYQ